MVLAVNRAGVVPTPPSSFVKLLQSGAISDNEIIKFFTWMDGVIRNGHHNNNGATSRNGTQDVRSLLNLFFASSRANELAGRLKTNPLNQTTNKYSADKHLTDYLKLDKPIVFFDIEIAGREAKDRKIVEISLIKIHPDGKEEKLDYRLNPEMQIEKEATDIHGIKDEDVKDSPTFKEISSKLDDFLKNCHLAGFNILTFDFGVLQKEFERAGIQFNKEGRVIIDPMKIYHKKVQSEEGKPRTLTAAYKYYCDKDLKNAHSSEADILATVEVLKGQFEMYDDLPREVRALGDYCRNGNSTTIDSKGKFVWEKRDGEWEIVFNFSSQHKGHLLKEVIAKDMGFINWMLKKDFDDDVKVLVKSAIKGIYPEPPSK